ncbi:5-(carboxyamino)imidazole ribonucleotide synthase [Blastochloris viridis]|uniref:N5-carboxyaminoimidazole ribonucleotide synthase n=1 Tax=Blastochloris viridis TaxID=1079 RepID=A0A0H5BBA9_BLAVI|nr:5-(carboxyamino)imidazole ribonucleotide synthase [Blastochloris viridis]ALK10498.1 N5-carboxyaminoimidazole ribonucleotide synthase [Blastochloris viridis]BAR99552.1 phosphoribosylaminoimidazole carboxylase ATPase subunit [Blastochloris viridis]CUU43160.1 N5-carboxyaminoimidazole ribonucleotide synthase [Blastochloris viridis]
MIKRDLTDPDAAGPVSPAVTLGILGGGQLGRMLALAAARLGIACHVYSDDPDSPAFEVVRRFTCAAYTDVAELARFAESVDLVTYEFENIPPTAVSFLESCRPVLPGGKALTITQDRLSEKRFVTGLGLVTAAFAPVDSLADLVEAVHAVGRPAILKTRRFGYDGKGQVAIVEDSDLGEAWRAIGEAPAILEAFVPFEREASVVAARGADGTVRAFDLTENVHRNHILHTSTVPAGVPEPVQQDALRIAAKIGEGLDFVGVFAVELFVLRAGATSRLVVNEIAPRVHNSGHWTLDGCTVSQFEQHVRAVCGLPLAMPRRLGNVVMTNLIGTEVEQWRELMAEPGAALHLYGKRCARAGRKMGHVTRISLGG